MLTGDGRRDERGSLIIAVGVLLVMTLLSVAILSRALLTLTSVRRTQDYLSALGGADSGLADSLYQIDQSRTATFSVNNGKTGAVSWSYTATKVDSNTWTVTSEGVANNVKHALQATVGRTALYPYAVFSQQDMTFNGNGGTNIKSYNSATGATDTGNAVIGSNHAIAISGGGGGNEQDYYSPNGSCSGCANGQQKAGPNVVTDPTPPTTYQACPVSGTFGGTVSGGGGLAYLCNQDVTFSGTITVTNGPLIVYVGANYAVNMADAVINMGSTVPPAAPTTKGTDFQLLKAGTGAFNVGPGSHAAKVNGIVYAPSSSITVDGGQMYFSGSLTVNQLTVHGNPNFTFWYDDAISTVVTSSWKVSGWHEIAAY